MQGTSNGLRRSAIQVAGARSFRVFIAIAARFDLELIQYDAVNAVVHARVNSLNVLEQFAAPSYGSEIR
jgi:hypothetical protein